MGTLKVNGNIETNAIIGSDTASGLVVQSKSTAGQSWGEGICILPHTDGFATLALGPADKTSACALVYHKDTKNHYLEVKTDNGSLFQSKIPYSTGLLLNSGNYTDYTVTKTGSGASGTWGINVSGNAATASKWATGRTFTIGETAKSVDGSSNMSWTIAEIGAPYVYHTQPSTTAYSYWGMLISRTRSTQGESGKGDNYYLGINSNSQLHIGHQLNGTASITWTTVLTQHNYSSYALPLSGGTLTGTMTTPRIHGNASNGGLRIKSITSNSIGWSEGVWVEPATNGYATVSAGKADGSSIISMVHNTDGRKHYLEMKNSVGQWTYYLPEAAGTIITTGNVGSQSVAWADVAGNASYLTMLGGTTTASVRNYDSKVSLATGGWADANAGYGHTWGTTLDISGYSTWYHRLAFRTDGHIEYWHGINTKTMSKVGNLITTANYTSYCAPASHSHSYASLASPNNLMHSGNEFTFVPEGYSGSVWFNYRAGWNTNGNISEYHFGNGKGGFACAIAQYFRTMNYGSGAPGSSTPGYGSGGAIYYQV